MKKYLIFLLLMAFMIGTSSDVMLAADQNASYLIALSEVPGETDGDGDDNDDEDGGSEWNLGETEDEGDSGGEDDDEDGGSE